MKIKKMFLFIALVLVFSVFLSSCNKSKRSNYNSAVITEVDTLSTELTEIVDNFVPTDVTESTDIPDVGSGSNSSSGTDKYYKEHLGVKITNLYNASQKNIGGEYNKKEIELIDALYAYYTYSKIDMMTEKQYEALGTEMSFEAAKKQSKDALDKLNKLRK